MSTNSTNQIYRQQIIDHYKNPRNQGTLKNYDAKHKSYNRACGDEIEVFISIKNNILQDFKFEPRGCAISIAAASLLSEEIIGMKIDEILELNEEFIQDLLGTKLTSSRIKCGMLPLLAVQKAIKDYLNEQFP
jgi:nitrogen fixation NifU-like protein